MQLRHLPFWLLCIQFGLKTGIAQTLDDVNQWIIWTGEKEQTLTLSNLPIGGRTDLMCNGALLLAKQASDLPFWKSTNFVPKGRWTSTWFDTQPTSLDISWCVYGQAQDMSTGWTKFAGNPLIAAHDYRHNTQHTLALPAHYSAQAADQSLVKGTGEYDGKWILLFNVGGWAVKGWAMAIADSLSPLKRGINPFRLGDPYPLTKATGGYNAPNDWIFAEGRWYAPDESRDHISRMWSSEDLIHWTLHGPIVGINGHDPGMVWDGTRYYLFNESNEDITLVSASDPLGEWKPLGPDPVLEVGDHTGDADVAFFNNQWHMFVDDGAHQHYKLSYAATSAELFPLGWHLLPEVLGPHQPEQGQLWDDDTPEGNHFGTGDADVVLDGHTVYLTYEYPVGIAYKELAVLDDTDQRVLARITYLQGDKPRHTDWQAIPVGTTIHDLTVWDAIPRGASWRLEVQLITDNPAESPLIEWIKIHP